MNIQWARREFGVMMLPKKDFGRQLNKRAGGELGPATRLGC
jgi:hypothetical protein